MHRSLASMSLLVALAVAPACGPSTDDGDDGATPSSGTTTDAQGSDSEGSTAEPTTSEPTASGTTTDPDTGSDTTVPIDCDALGVDECPPACHSVAGTEATPEGEPGEYYCSDLRVPFACAPLDCEPFSGDMILCSLEEPGVARWVIEDCIPAGWEPCPDDAICA